MTNLLVKLILLLRLWNIKRFDYVFGKKIVGYLCIGYLNTRVAVISYFFFLNASYFQAISSYVLLLFIKFHLHVTSLISKKGYFRYKNCSKGILNVSLLSIREIAFFKKFSSDEIESKNYSVCWHLQRICCCLVWLSN